MKPLFLALLFSCLLGCQSRDYRYPITKVDPRLIHDQVILLGYLPPDKDGGPYLRLIKVNKWKQDKIEMMWVDLYDMRGMTLKFQKINWGDKLPKEIP